MLSLNMCNTDGNKQTKLYNKSINTLFIEISIIINTIIQ